MTITDYQWLIGCNVTAWSIAGAALLLAWAAYRRAGRVERGQPVIAAALDDVGKCLRFDGEDIMEFRDRIAALEEWRAHQEANAEAAGKVLDAAGTIPQTCDNCSWWPENNPTVPPDGAESLDPENCYRGHKLDRDGYGHCGGVGPDFTPTEGT